MSPTIVVAGIGNGSGIGGATARRFAKEGFNVALIARNADALNKFAAQLSESGAKAAAFPLSGYTYSELERVFGEIKSKFPNDPIRVTVWNAGDAVWKSFLETTEEDVRRTADTVLIGSFAFAKQSILAFKDQELDAQGSRGTFIITAATAATRGNVTTSAFAAGKFATRGLSQSLAKEFGKQNIHVAHVVVDGAVVSDKSTEQRLANNPNYLKDEDIRLDPNAIAETYYHLAHQHRSAWTWELDVRPAHEKW